MSIIRKEQLTNPLSASYALTASYAENASSTSANTSSLVTTSSFNAFTASINTFTSSYNTGSFSGSFTGSLRGTASTASYYQETDPIFVAKSASLATTGSNTFRGNQTISGSILLGSGSIISESGSNTIITPPGAQIGQSLVIRPTSGDLTITSSGFIVAGVTLTITLNSSQYSAASLESFYYELSGSTAQQLGLGSLIGQFNQVNWVDSGGNTGYNQITIPIPIDSTAAILKMTITGSSGNFGGYVFTNNPFTVTNNGIINNEVSHIHLISGDPSTVDLYLGDDDQYVKIEKNAGNVVIGTNLNTNQWVFNTSGSLIAPGIITATAFTGSLLGTASWAQSASQAITASYYKETDPIFTAVSGTFVLTSSFNAFTSSINTFTSSYNTGSFSGSFTGSFNGTASWAQSASQALTASFVPNAFYKEAIALALQLL
jgi:hypothetical protein